MQTRYPATAMLLLCWLSAVGCSASPEEQARAALSKSAERSVPTAKSSSFRLI